MIANPTRMLLLTLVGAACAGGRGTGPMERVVIPEGVGLGTAAESLAAHGLISSQSWFAILGRLGRYHRSIKPGMYDIPQGTSARAILDMLKRGEVVTLRFTVPEGLTIAEVAQLAQAELDIPSDSLELAARDTILLRQLGIVGNSAEGFLAPQTYTIPGLSTARDLVQIMIKQFNRSWDPAWDDSLGSRGLSRLEAVTLASIVEGEAQLDEERPIIAGVYLNRLRLGMALQADPTVQYAIQLATGSRKSRLFEKDYDTPSPYNTYLHPGLPPGPVGSPGVNSLDAVMAPATVPWLYFVASGGGRHTFSRTYQEHLRAVAQVRRER